MSPTVFTYKSKSHLEMLPTEINDEQNTTGRLTPAARQNGKICYDKSCSKVPFHWITLSVESSSAAIMKFIEMTGKVLAEIVSDDELHAGDLKGAGVLNETIVRINEQGDIEVRRSDQWDVIGGLLGNFEERIQGKTGLEWA